MAYRIMYSPEDDRKYPGCNLPKKNKWILPVVLAGSILTATMVPQLRDWAGRWLIPGDAQVTKAAFSVMIDEIRTGEPLGEAVSAFCREILENGSTEEILYT